MLRLAGGDREARVDDDHRGARADGVGELLHLAVVHVLAQVGADEDQAAGLGDVGPLRGRDLVAERQLEADIARPAALGVGGRDEVRRAERLEGVLEEVAADAVAEEGERLRPVLGLDLLQLLGDVARAPRPR